MRTLNKVGLPLTIIAVSSSIPIVAYETVQNIRYQRWKSNYDNFGWFGKITVPSSNSKLMWEYKPYAEHGNIETNRYGFRDYDYASKAKPDNTYRIAFLGDSVVLGMGVEHSRIFVRLFERKAKKRNRTNTIQAMNFGVDGYNVIQIYELLKTRVLDFSPDKVVYVLCLNDFDLDEASGLKGRYFKKPKSFLLERIEELYMRLRKKEYHSYHFRKNRDTLFEEILRMKDLLSQHKTSFQIVLMPAFPYKHPKYRDLVYKVFVNYPLSEIHREIAHFMSQHEIELFDLLDAFQQQPEGSQYYAYDVWHPNVRGHRFIAYALLGPVLKGTF